MARKPNGNGQRTARKEASKPAESSAPESVTVTLPVKAPPENAYITEHVDLVLSPKQRLAVRYVLEGLQAGNMRLQSGRLPNSIADAVRYVFERIATMTGGSDQ